MKSPMIQNATYINDEDKKNYTDLQVMHSPAGYYIGTYYRDESGLEPGTRDSNYFATRESAQVMLDHLIKEGDEYAAKILRKHP
jgi:hypothetical protein